MKEVTIGLISVPWPFGLLATLRERPRYLRCPSQEFIVFGFESVEIVSRIACFKLTADD
ncbi:MAG: hypothetical protein F6K55_46790 [Moorea sp. SIO4A3]|nr:hypothetical protein [Moorena sp. SIO4A3]